MFLDKEILDKKIDEPIVLSVDQNIQFIIQGNLKTKYKFV